MGKTVLYVGGWGLGMIPPTVVATLRISQGIHCGVVLRTRSTTMVYVFLSCIRIDSSNTRIVPFYVHIFFMMSQDFDLLLEVPSSGFAFAPSDDDEDEDEEEEEDLPPIPSEVDLNDDPSIAIEQEELCRLSDLDDDDIVTGEDFSIWPGL